ncbi:MAG: universal stress protein [Thaumarchaeota archaeon]|nr:universal stress protein [Nitrososphaerota archaeon]
MKEILVAVDGSKHSEKIVDYAIDLAKTMSAKIALIYVMPELSIPEDYKKYAEEEKISRPESSYLRSVAERILADLGERIRRKGVEYEEAYTVGYPAEAILHAVERRRVDLVVVGVRGLHGLGRLRALGSVARKIIENSPVPVIAIPGGEVLD